MEKASIGKPEHRKAAGLNGVSLDSITSGGYLTNRAGDRGRQATEATGAPLASNDAWIYT